MSSSRLPADPVRVHDILIEQVVKRRRLLPGNGGVMVMLPPGLERLMFASDMLHRLRVDSTPRLCCLIASNNAGVLNKIRKFQSRRYGMPAADVCHRLGSGETRQPQHVCSLGEFDDLGKQSLTGFDVAILLCTNSNILRERYYQARLRYLAMTRFVVLVVTDPVPRAIARRLERLTIWKWV